MALNLAPRRDRPSTVPRARGASTPQSHSRTAARFAIRRPFATSTWREEPHCQHRSSRGKDPRAHDSDVAARRALDPQHHGCCSHRSGGDGKSPR